jgi:rRNA maturation endonuclease Nob1
MERDPEESPCPGCGVYYFDLHQPGCEFEECPVCGGQVVACTCFDAPKPG